MYEVCDEKLEYSVEGKYPDKFSEEQQEKFLLPLKKLIESSETPVKKNIKLEVIPSLLKRERNLKDCIKFNPINLSDWLPNAFSEYLEK